MPFSTSAQPLEYEQLSYNAPDGSQWGKTSTEKWAVGGATPTAVSTIIGVNITSNATTLTVSTAPFGFTTSTQANNILLVINELVRKGIVG